MIVRFKLLESVEVAKEKKPLKKRVKKPRAKSSTKVKTNIALPNKSISKEILGFINKTIIEIDQDVNHPIRIVKMQITGEFNYYIFASLVNKIKGIYHIYKAVVREESILRPGNDTSSRTTIEFEPVLVMICNYQALCELKAAYTNLIVNDNEVKNCHTMKKALAKIKHLENWSTKERTLLVADYLKQKKNNHPPDHDYILFSLELFYLEADFTGYQVCKNNLLESLALAKAKVVNSYRNDDIEVDKLMLKVDKQNLEYFKKHIINSVKNQDSNSFINNHLVNALKYHTSLSSKVKKL